MLLLLGILVLFPLSASEAVLCPDWLVFAGHPKAIPHSGVSESSKNTVLFYSLEAAKRMVLLRSKAKGRPGYEVAALGITRTVGSRTEVVRIIAPEDTVRGKSALLGFIPPPSDLEDPGPPDFYGFDETYFQFAQEAARDLGGELNYLIRWRQSSGSGAAPSEWDVTLGFKNIQECERLGIEWAEIRLSPDKSLTEDLPVAVYRMSEVRLLAARLKRKASRAPETAVDNHLFPHVVTEAYRD